MICLLVNVSRLKEIAEDAKSKFGNSDAKHLFLNNPAVGSYFDNIAEAAGFLKIALRARDEVTSCTSRRLELGKDFC